MSQALGQAEVCAQSGEEGPVGGLTEIEAARAELRQGHGAKAGTGATAQPHAGVRQQGQHLRPVRIIRARGPKTDLAAEAIARQEQAAIKFPGVLGNATMAQPDAVADIRVLAGGQRRPKHRIPQAKFARRPEQ